MDLDSQKSTCSTSVRSYLLYTKRPHRLQACQPHSFLVPFPIFAVEHVGIQGNPHRGFFTHAFRLYAPRTVIHYTASGLLNRLKTASSPYAAAPNCTSPARWGVRTVPATRITALMSVQTNPFTTYPLSALAHSHALLAVRSRSCWTAPIDYLVRTRVLYGLQDSAVLVVDFVLFGPAARFPRVLGAIFTIHRNASTLYSLFRVFDNPPPPPRCSVNI